LSRSTSPWNAQTSPPAKLNPNLKVHVRATDLSDERAVIELGEWLEREKIAIHIS
jgi:hypothetical protein